ncbi:MAG TPA: hypothetical protein VGB43_08295 [Flavobacterium sp.]|jgi:nitrite reductase/ring-hydroxylating ferredoxin subunit
MKKYLLLLLIIPFLSGCEKENYNNNNPFIPNYSFSEVIDPSLPAYSQLQYSGNGIYYGSGGARGLLVFNTGSGYTAFDAACPNKSSSPCAILTLNGINGVCQCNEEAYSLFSGQCPGQKYPLKPYRVEIVGGAVRVYN